jgi:hypothetical protein
VIAQFERDHLLDHVGPRLFRINRAALLQVAQPERVA